MSTHQHFAIESLEARNETFWFCYPYVSICVGYIGPFRYYYPCVKIRCIWI